MVSNKVKNIHKKVKKLFQLHPINLFLSTIVFLKKAKNISSLKK